MVVGTRGYYFLHVRAGDTLVVAPTAAEDGADTRRWWVMVGLQHPQEWEWWGGQGGCRLGFWGAEWGWGAEGSSMHVGRGRNPARTLLEPCRNPAGILLEPCQNPVEPCRNPAGTLPEPCEPEAASSGMGSGAEPRYLRSAPGATGSPAAASSRAAPADPTRPAGSVLGFPCFRKAVFIPVPFRRCPARSAPPPAGGLGRPRSRCSTSCT